MLTSDNEHVQRTAQIDDDSLRTSHHPPPPTIRHALGTTKKSKDIELEGENGSYAS